nr:MAG: ribosomal biogenesis protein Nop56/Nop58 [Candidatus Nanosalinarum sp. J07AB56]
MSSRREEALKSAREELSAPDREAHLVMAVRFLDAAESDTGENRERLADWYSVHFPELVEEVGRGNLPGVLERGVRRSELDGFSSLAEGSTGSELTDREAEVLRSAVERVNSAADDIQRIERFVESEAPELMPSLSRLLGPVLAARVVSEAGGLEKLARMPSSTVQVLGAEEALFRHLHGDGTSPKHGVLFHHEFVEGLPEENRGKMARFLANKAVIAARVDHYGDGDKGPELHEEAQSRFRELNER